MIYPRPKSWNFHKLVVCLHIPYYAQLFKVVNFLFKWIALPKTIKFLCHMWHAECITSMETCWCVTNKCQSLSQHFFEAAFIYVPFGIFQWIFSFGYYLLWALAWHRLFGCQSVALSWCAAHSLKWQTSHCSSSIGHAWVTLCFHVLWGLWIIIHKWHEVEVQFPWK